MKALLSNSLVKGFTIAICLVAFSTSAYAQVLTTDTVCAVTQDKVYGITNSNPTSTYQWYISPATGGTIDNSIVPNDSIIEIDWGVTAGTYRLYAIETSINGCIGDSILLDVVVNPLPTAVAVSDSVCPGFSATLTVTLTGTAPWSIDYTDGSNNYNSVANASPHTISLPNYTASQTITVTGVTDNNTCAADTSVLPAVNVHVYPSPTPGNIYHY